MRAAKRRKAMCRISIQPDAILEFPTPTSSRSRAPTKCSIRKSNATAGRSMPRTPNGIRPEQKAPKIKTRDQANQSPHENLKSSAKAAIREMSRSFRKAGIFIEIDRIAAPRAKSEPDAVRPRGAPLARERDDGAQERTRTSTAVRPLAPEASASTSSATWAQGQQRGSLGGERGQVNWKLAEK